jgi:N-acetylglutamate synthase-like GNAT family acetyltransferase
MIVRRAKKEDMPYIARIAWRLALDYPGMENDIFFMAEERGKVAGILGLKDLGDFLEMLAVGVLEEYRKMGTGRKLVEEALKTVRGRQVYLLTTIPGFFESLGFEKANEIPEGLKKDPPWCAGCQKEKCAVMHKIA